MNTSVNSLQPELCQITAIRARLVLNEHRLGIFLLGKEWGGSVGRELLEQRSPSVPVALGSF